VLRWRDGEVTHFSDNTIATVEDATGERVVDPVVSQMFGAAPTGAPINAPAYEDAVVRRDGDHAFVLQRRTHPSLARLDLEPRALRYQLPLKLEGEDKLEILAGIPVVRSSPMDMKWVRVFDPETGRLVYEDQRSGD
jgi:hypothetical protein